MEVMKRLVPSSLRYRLVWLVALTLFPLLGLGLYLDHELQRYARDDARKEVLNQVQVVAGEMDHALMDTRDLLVGLATLSEEGLAASELRSIFRSLKLPHPYYLNLGIATPDGDVRLSAVPSDRLVNIADRPYFQDAVASRRFVIGGYQVGRITGRPGLNLAQPIMEHGEVRGVIFAALDLAWLEDRLAGQHVLPGAVLTVLDAQGTVLAHHPAVAGIVGRRLPSHPPISAALAEKAPGVISARGLDGQLRLYAYSPVSIAGKGAVYVLAGLPETAFFARVNRLKLQGYLTLALVALLAMAAAWTFASRLILHPLHSVIGAVGRLGRGDTKARTGLTGLGGELGELARSFDQLAEDLEQERAALDRTQRSLRLLGESNRNLLRAESESHLLELVCRVAVEAGGYRMAWVGYAQDDPGRSVLPVAHSGIEEGQLEALHLSWAGEEDCPLARAIHARQPVVIADVSREPGCSGCGEVACLRDCTSLAVLPLVADDKALGVLVLYAGVRDPFDGEELQILQEMAADLAFGIANLRLREKQRQADAVLRESEERYRLLLNGLHEHAVLMLDPEGHVTSWNPGAEHITGYRAEEIVGQSFMRFYPPEDLAAGKPGRQLETALAEGRAEDEGWRLRKDGSRFWANVVMSAVRDETGTLRGYAKITRDLSDRRRLRNALESMRRRLEQVLGAAGEGIIALDSRGCHLFVNPAAAAMLGYQPDELIGREAHGLWHHHRAGGSTHPIEDCSILAAMHDGARHESAEEVFWRKDGLSFPAQYTSTPFYEEEGLLGVVLVFQDITERKRNEAALLRLNCTLRTLSACNEELVHAREEPALLEAMCRVAVETGGYAAACVGYRGPDARLRLVAHRGAGEALLQALLPVTAERASTGELPFDRAIRTGTSQVVADLSCDPDFEFMRETILQAGIGSCLTLPLAMDEAPFGVLAIFAAEPGAFAPDAIQLLEELASDLSYGIQTLRTRAERDSMLEVHLHHEEILRAGLEDTIQAIAATVEKRDPYTAGHQRRVADLAVAIARELGLPEEDIHGIHLAGIVHDLGKIHIPAEILSRPGRLSEIEYLLIQGHPQVGYDILKDVKFPWPIAQMVLQHHERQDGSGYPNGLQGESILLGARILAVADVVEAMCSHRPYRPGLGAEKAQTEIEKNRGRLYDAAVAEACLRLFREKGYAFE